MYHGRAFLLLFHGSHVAHFELRYDFRSVGFDLVLDDAQNFLEEDGSELTGAIALPARLSSLVHS